MDGVFGPVRNPWQYKFKHIQHSNELKQQKAFIPRQDSQTDSELRHPGSIRHLHSSGATNTSTAKDRFCDSSDTAEAATPSMWIDPDDYYITGGSSGGSAVAVATGAVFG